MFVSSFIILTGMALSATKPLPAGTSSQNLVLRNSSSSKEKSFYAVSDLDVQTARCLRKEPFSDREMLGWLEAQSKLDADSKLKELSGIDALAWRKDAEGPLLKQQNNLGLRLEGDTPYLRALLAALLTKESQSEEPQPTYSSECRSALCVSQEVFGERVGLQLLFMLGRYGFNGSHLRVKNADLWTSGELDLILLALSDLPPHLMVRAGPAMNHPLVHARRTDHSPSRPIANALIYIFNEWNRLTPGLQRYVLLHELGHNMGLDFGFDGMKSWYRAGAWAEKDFEWKTSNVETKISQYAESDPNEDYAETFAAYRYAPVRLKLVSPNAYRFMKRTVFRNIEYANEQSCRPQ